jgi:hypothetical protein
MNEDVDLPLMAENREEKIIEKAVHHLMHVICGLVYTNTIKTMLNESLPNEQ